MHPPTRWRQVWTRASCRSSRARLTDKAGRKIRQEAKHKGAEHRGSHQRVEPIEHPAMARDDPRCILYAVEPLEAGLEKITSLRDDRDDEAGEQPVHEVAADRAGKCCARQTRTHQRTD